MNLSARHLINLLERNGFYYKRSNGSHRLFYNPTTGITVIVPVHSKKDLAKGLFYAILKQAGIEKEEI